MNIYLHGILAHEFEKCIKLPKNIDLESIFDFINLKHSDFKIFIQKKAFDKIFFQIIKKEDSYHLVPIICGNISSVFSLLSDVAFNALQTIGMNFALGGILSLIAPGDQNAKAEYAETVVLQSTRFTNLQNTESQGERVPVGYGRLRVGSKLVMQYTEPKNWSDGRPPPEDELTDRK